MKYKLILLTLLIVLLSSFTIAENIPLQANNSVFYSFDDLTNISDGSGHDLTGLNSGSTFTPSGYFNGARSFDGVNDKITTKSFHATEMSFGGWVKFDSIDDTQHLFGDLGTGTNSRSIYV